MRDFPVGAIDVHVVLKLTCIIEEFTIYMNYVRKLGFEETPDYDFLRELFTKVLKTLGEPEDGVFDWMLLKDTPSVRHLSVLLNLVSFFVGSGLLGHHPCHASSRAPSRTRS